MTGLSITDELANEYLRALTDSNRPLWLLDIDGVLRAFDADPDWPELPRTRTSAGFSVKFAPSLIHWIQDLVREQAVDVIWSTTWCGRVDRMLDVFDLPGYSPDPAKARTVEAWNWYCNGEPAMLLKLASLQVALDTGRPVIHTDDHVAVNFEGPNYLAIRPDSERGLSQDHMVRIADFIKTHQ
ncbi:HAD domain-containing protein [Glycomyces sp. YM15]|uniref:HAD domain-containing protein n=1 Tax=Glycomyces sp. YM15 TaxID=2800446 RepID=UPI0019649248|nr:HAD domain-containing protein [Glycomyces sp. YM15]